jgi:hypothetical protein
MFYLNSKERYTHLLKLFERWLPLVDIIKPRLNLQFDAVYFAYKANESVQNCATEREHSKIIPTLNTREFIIVSPILSVAQREVS